MKPRIFLSLLTFTFLSGCATLDKYYEERRLLLNPKRLNESDSKGTNAYDGMQIAVSAYYMAMDNAKTDYQHVPAKRAEPMAIFDYIDAGITLTNSYCRQWFHRISDAERGLALSTKNINIIRDLGTVALGIANASPTTVTVYGALNTAFSGAQENFSAALLTAPAQRRVQTKVFEIMSFAASHLRNEALSLTFPQAYDRLNVYAEICTFATIKDVVEDALSSTQTTVVPLSGRLITTPAPASTLLR